ncbi:site-specific DNA-methyltransferase [Pararhodobacter oceanensis]|uniref:site-specific DNA-methyltransferase (adenine-specific) n=2 Tax=Pararhodobacter oceanensis TaxID=2172121 RepID=A0A2T8HP48_9RHOB|nr:site-specific DNA-methyltransferase [Pararhodobacter oceanensis]
MHSPDLTQDNIAKIRALFPGCVTEAAGEDGATTLKVDFDQLRQELSDSIVEGPQERYHLDWPGKRQAQITANAPIAKTLRPVREESVDFDTTQNLFIEGDNLEALKLLQETYLGKVKMIYIDPPYNTGNDFVYEDDFAESAAEFLTKSNQVDAAGNRLVANTESNGRFHSDWLSMMYPRLRLAKNLLNDDGVIFITIDDNEVSNLRNLCDYVFGEINFRALVSWQKKYAVSNNFKGIASVRDFILIYSKSDSFQNGLLPRTEASKVRYQNPDNDPRGPWKPVDYWNIASVDQRPNCVYPIVNPNTGETTIPQKKSWKFERTTHEKHVKEDKVWWGKGGKNSVPALKLFLSEVKDGMIPHNWWPHEEAGHTDQAKKQLDVLFDGVAPFDTPKPQKLLERIIQIANISQDDIVLDFFAGSASTAEACFRFAATQGVPVRSIMVQVPEACFPKSEGEKQGFSTIAEISKERIRRAGAKILEGECHPDWNRDVGFRVLKIDSSNMADVYYTPDDTTQADLLARVDNIKPDRTPEDLLFQVLLDWGVDLTLPITRETLHGKTVFFVAGTALAACFDTGVDEVLVKDLAARAPLRVVFKDTGFKDDATKINVKQIFKSLSPDTDVKAI